MVPHRLGHLLDHLELFAAHDLLALLRHEVLPLLRGALVGLARALVDRAVADEEVPLPCVVTLERVDMAGAAERQRGRLGPLQLAGHHE